MAKHKIFLKDSDDVPSKYNDTTTRELYKDCQMFMARQGPAEFRVPDESNGGARNRQGGQLSPQQIAVQRGHG